ncbi:ribosome-associated translation inhibitor RaiA [Vibrio sp. S17_S38]|uniref:ribosome hibernation-promoting factor, HPF/YfiA family n=1 Tax=Vibrio sp. S17_S38 TaxID=2720229 RepID=UPI001680C508|nr:ribosome-associated translation inhibitor RaiA [Vibrio sp. S17_S38]MBD1574185.1 ribosome-associated translation inhibitor RaiA [Vibrio sp. S17_S38]
MKVSIIGKNIDITSSIREHIEAKFKKLEKWQVDLISCQANISTEPANQKKIEATVTVPKGQLVASAMDEDLYKAINEVEQKLERQLNKLSHKPEAKRNKVLNDELELLEETEA